MLNRFADAAANDTCTSKVSRTTKPRANPL
jgi:hypothetical protein